MLKYKEFNKIKKMKSKSQIPEGLNHELEEFIESNLTEVTHRYNSLLKEIKEAKGNGILSIHNRHFGSKGLYFGGAVQYLYRKNKGQPLPEETNSETTSPNFPATVESIIGPVKQAATQASQAEDNDNDESELVAKNAS
jgi:hypothetical protein